MTGFPLRSGVSPSRGAADLVYRHLRWRFLPTSKSLDPMLLIKYDMETYEEVRTDVDEVAHLNNETEEPEWNVINVGLNHQDTNWDSVDAADQARNHVFQWLEHIGMSWKNTLYYHEDHRPTAEVCPDNPAVYTKNRMQGRCQSNSSCENGKYWHTKTVKGRDTIFGMMLRCCPPEEAVQAALRIMELANVGKTRPKYQG